MGQDLNASDTARLEWCISTLDSVKDLGRNEPMGDKWRDVVMVIGALKRVLQPNLSATIDARELKEDDPWLSVKYQKNLSLYCAENSGVQPRDAERQPSVMAEHVSIVPVLKIDANI